MGQLQGRATDKYETVERMAQEKGVTRIPQTDSGCTCFAAGGIQELAEFKRMLQERGDTTVRGCFYHMEAKHWLRLKFPFTTEKQLWGTRVLVVAQEQQRREEEEELQKLRAEVAEAKREKRLLQETQRRQQETPTREEKRPEQEKRPVPAPVKRHKVAAVPLPVKIVPSAQKATAELGQRLFWEQESKIEHFNKMDRAGVDIDRMLETMLDFLRESFLKGNHAAPSYMLEKLRRTLRTLKDEACDLLQGSANREYLVREWGPRALALIALFDQNRQRDDRVQGGWHEILASLALLARVPSRSLEDAACRYLVNRVRERWMRGADALLENWRSHVHPSLLV